MKCVHANARLRAPTCLFALPPTLKQTFISINSEFSHLSLFSFLLIKLSLKPIFKSRALASRSVVTALGRAAVLDPLAGD